MMTSRHVTRPCKQKETDKGLSPVSPIGTESGLSYGEDFWRVVADQGATMRQKSEPDKAPAQQMMKDIRRATRRQFLLRGPSVRRRRRSASCARARAARSAFRSHAAGRGSPARNIGWSKEFLDAGKTRLAGDKARAATARDRSRAQTRPGLLSAHLQAQVWD